VGARLSSSTFRKWKNIDIAKIKGAYCIVTFNDDTTDAEIMTMEQIRKAWKQGAAKGDSVAHNNFTDEMCKKTVIQRALKLRIGSSDDSALYDEEEQEADPQTAGVRLTIKENANKKSISMDQDDAQHAEEVEDENPAPTPQDETEEENPI
jgi:recombination protein RecT